MKMSPNGRILRYYDATRLPFCLTRSVVYKVRQGSDLIDDFVSSYNGSTDKVATCMLSMQL